MLLINSAHINTVSVVMLCSREILHFMFRLLSPQRNSESRVMESVFLASLEMCNTELSSH